MNATWGRPAVQDLDTVEKSVQHLDLGLKQRVDSVVEYDSREPVFFMHIPRCGGTALSKLFQFWFPQSCHVRDFPAALKGDLQREPRLGPGAAVFGHFSSAEGGSIEDLYPAARQFVTFVRDPFDILVSNYFFLKNGRGQWKGKPEIQTDLREYLSKKIHSGEHNLFFRYLPSKPPGIGPETYLREKFLFAGDFSRFQKSVNRLALVLGQSPASAPSLNDSFRDETVPEELRADAKEAFPEEYAFYDAVGRSLTK
jgi:hypothetical protein